MSKGICANVRGLTSPSRQVWITNQLAGNKFGLLTEIKNKFSLGNNWSTFCSDCRGSGGAAVCLCKRSYPHPELLYRSTHAVAVEADNTVFIALYVPCGANIHDTSFILPWIPCSPKKCIIGGDWNRLATKTQWLQMLEERGLHVCKNPLPFTRVQPDGRPGATLDRVAASCHTVVTHLQASGLTDHLIMHVKIGHSAQRPPIPEARSAGPRFCGAAPGVGGHVRWILSRRRKRPWSPLRALGGPEEVHREGSTQVR